MQSETSTTKKKSLDKDKSEKKQDSSTKTKKDKKNVQDDILLVSEKSQDNTQNQIDTDENLDLIEPELLDDENFDLDDVNDEHLLENIDLEDDSFYDIESDDLLSTPDSLENSYDSSLPVPVETKQLQVKKTHLPNVLVRDNLQLYLREISSFPLLSPEEEIEITKKIKESQDMDATFRLVSSHLRLVVKIAMEFQRRWMQNVLDLVQEGNIGLLRAVNKFDPEKGIKFSYYATFWIRAYILKFIMDNWRMVKIGTTQAQRKLFYNLNKEKQKLISQGFNPDLEVLSERLGVSKEHISEMEQRLDSTDLSLDMPVTEEHGSVSRIDYLPALTQGIEEGFAEHEITDIIRTKIEEFIPLLTDKEVFILENRLLTDDPMTLREIGEKYEVTRERIRQLEARLVAKMRNYFKSEIDDFSEDWIQED